MTLPQRLVKTFVWFCCIIFVALIVRDIHVWFLPSLTAFLIFAIGIPVNKVINKEWGIYDDSDSDDGAKSSPDARPYFHYNYAQSNRRPRYKGDPLNILAVIAAIITILLFISDCIGR